MCPRCGALKAYSLKGGRRWKCRERKCAHFFSVTSSTVFSSRKMPFGDILLAISKTVQGPKGTAALRIARELGCQHKTAFVLLHKIREVLADSYGDVELEGTIEIDGALFGHYVRPANWKCHRVDLRKAENWNPNRTRVMVFRQRHGPTLTGVFKEEYHAFDFILERLNRASVIHTDLASGLNGLAKHFAAHYYINHNECYHDGFACTNWAESYFSLLRRAARGTYHRVIGPYLDLYAAELAWRGDHRRVADAEIYLETIRLALGHPVSRRMKGYWQRRKAA